MTFWCAFHDIGRYFRAVEKTIRPHNYHKLLFVIIVMILATTYLIPLYKEHFVGSATPQCKHT